MSFVNFPNPTPLFPSLPGRGWSVHKRPTWASNVAVHISGKEKIASRQAFPLWEFELTHEVLREQTQNIVPDQYRAGYTELQQVSQLFLSCYGQYGEFYFEDPEDNSRLLQDQPLPGNGTSGPYQIYRVWGQGSLKTFEPIAALNNSFPVDVLLNHVSLVYGTHFTITQGNNGVFINFTAPAPLNSLITTSFYYYYRCRFTEDIQDYNQFMHNLWEYRSCRIRTVKP